MTGLIANATPTVLYPNLNIAIELVQSFADLVRDHEPEKLKEWYEKANSCQIKDDRKFCSWYQRRLGSS